MIKCDVCETRYSTSAELIEIHIGAGDSAQVAGHACVSCRDGDGVKRGRFVAYSAHEHNAEATRLYMWLSHIESLAENASGLKDADAMRRELHRIQYWMNESIRGGSSITPDKDSAPDVYDYVGLWPRMVDTKADFGAYVEQTP